jgi:hypothetical protein
MKACERYDRQDSLYKVLSYINQSYEIPLEILLSQTIISCKNRILELYAFAPFAYHNLLFLLFIALEQLR